VVADYLSNRWRAPTAQLELTDQDGNSSTYYPCRCPTQGTSTFEMCLTGSGLVQVNNAFGVQNGDKFAFRLYFEGGGGFDFYPSRILLNSVGMRVRLVRKLADRVDGIDLSHCDVGEVIELPEPDGRLIIAERWGEFARRQADLVNGRDPSVASADRRSSSDLYERLKQKHEEIDDRRQYQRRVSDDPHAPAPHAT
jgi:hypothetical protein